MIKAVIGACLFACMLFTAEAVNRCGTSYNDAATKCVKCPAGVESECPAGEGCYAGFQDCDADEAAPPAPDCPSSLPTLRLNSGFESEGLAAQQPQVAFVQEAVGAEVDGLFGPDTEAKVEAFQSSEGLEVDGVVGPNTWAALGCRGGGTPPAGTPTAGSCELSNPTSAQAKTDCSFRAVDTGSMCWTDRAYTLYQRIQACNPNIQCTTYPSGSSSDHEGNALDCWGTQDELHALADWGVNNAIAIKIGFVNWHQRMWSQGRSTEGWRSYSDRGDDTANHYDHVHFSVCAGSYNAASYGC